MNESSSRPDPDKLLHLIKTEEKKSQRGKLKIFFGGSAGVGKTYAMLSAAHELVKNGIDVVVGIVETHQRPETEKLLQGLDLLPPHIVSYRGMTLCELNLDAAKQRKPQVILVDELAHTNAPNLSHPKRWNDVLDLLDSGIDVYTTLNVQHIESLSDVVAGSTGIWMKETIPDSIFDAADDIVLVDIDADELLKRLSEGKVYIAPQAKARAAENFFKKNNLIALRELALRRTAERVDAQMELYSSTGASDHHQPIADKILVCIAPDPISDKLVRATKRMASGLKAQWEAVYVECPGNQVLNETGQQSLDALGRMIDRIGGKMVILQGDDRIDTLLAYARKYNFSKVVAGKVVKPFWRTSFRERFVERLIHKSGSNIDVYVITDESADLRKKFYNSDIMAERDPQLYTVGLLITALCGALAYALRDFVSMADVALVFLVNVVFVASVVGRGPAFVAALVVSVFFNVFFIPPYNILDFLSREHLVTFVIMLISGVVLSNLVSRMRLQTLAARNRETRTQSLYRLTKDLTSTRGRQNVSDAVAKNLSDMMNVNVTIWLAGPEGPPVVVIGSLPEENFVREMGVLQWSFDNGKIAGRSTNTMPSATGLYFPLITSTGPFGVLGVFSREKDHDFSLDEISSVETVASLLASALERVRTGELAEQARVKAESEKLLAELQHARNAILKAQEAVALSKNLNS